MQNHTEANVEYTIIKETHVSGWNHQGTSGVEVILEGHLDFKYALALVSGEIMTDGDAFVTIRHTVRIQEHSSTIKGAASKLFD